MATACADTALELVFVFIVKIDQLKAGQQHLKPLTENHSPFKTYWPAGGGRGKNPENTAQGNSGQNAIRP